MGLVGFCLAPMMGAGAPSTISPPRPSPAGPALWLKLMSDNRCDHRLFADLRLRSRGAPRSMAMRRRSICPAGASPASAATWCGRHARALRRDAGAGGLRPPAPSCRATAWPRSTLAITFADARHAASRIDVVDRVHYKLTPRAVPASGIARDARRTRALRRLRQAAARP